MRRKFITRVTDQDGVAQSSAAVFALRSGAPLASGGATSVPANSTAVVRLRHPGALRVNDEVYWVTDYNGVPVGNFRITAISAYNPSGYWSVTLLDLSGSTTAIGTTGDLVLKWNITDHYVFLYTNDSGATGINGVAPISSTTGEVSFYADVPQLDLAITNGGVLQRYVRDLTTEPKYFIQPEEFGAVGDGTTDDTDAIQNALDWASEVEGGAIVWFQKPSYLCTGATASSANVSIRGYGIPVNITGGKPRIMFGSDNPEGNVTCPIGSIYQKTSGTSDDALYVKETGTGNTGWVAFKTTYLPLSGGTMSGDIDLNGNAIKILGSVVIENSIGDPNGAITGNPGSVYINRSGGSSVSLWVKESGVLSNTGWVALASTSGFTMTGDIDLGGNKISEMAVTVESTAGAATTAPAANTGFLVITGTGTAISKISGCAAGKVLKVMFSNATPNTLTAAATPASDEIMTALTPTRYKVYTLVGWNDGTYNRWVVSN